MMAVNEHSLDRVYAAISDPTRRGILAELRKGEANVCALAERFPMSLNGVSKHLKVLERAGLVERTVRGREHRLRLRAAPLRQAADWLQHYQAFWEARLDALEELLIADRGAAATAAPKHPRAVRGRRRR